MRGVLAFTLGAAVFATLTLAAPPAWWAERGVTSSQATPNDYAAANIGQVKHIAAKAVAEMNAKIEGGAGADLNALIAGWIADAPSGVARNDYAPINQGQLKVIAKKFYKRLFAAGYRGQPLGAGQKYPWTETPNDDASYALANIGQVKRLFSFIPSLSDPRLADTDEDEMPDFWERYYDLDPNNAADASLDSDGDELPNLQEYLAGRHPKNRADKTGTLPSGADVVLAVPGYTFYKVNKTTGAISTTTAP